MPVRHTHLSPLSAGGQLAEALAALRIEFAVPDGFPAAVLEEASEAPSSVPEPDLRDIDFVTLDPQGSRDLDQAFHIERRSGGYRVRYAIADLPGHVPPGGALDAEARLRGQTLYLPDARVPLHPPTLSEDRASLLPGQDRPAFVWTIDLDETGAATDARVERAVIRSRAQLDYEGAQRAFETGTVEGPLALLPEVGKLRIAQERARGGASLNMPDEEIVRDPEGYRIVRRYPLPVEDWNAQLSLLTGIAAGEMMLDGGIGVLRIMPPPGTGALGEFRSRVAALGQPWSRNDSYGEYLRGLDTDEASTPAILQAAASLFRGAEYAPFDGEAPAETEQAAIAAPYAHVTAPLRRLVDRWGLVICEALCTDRPVPSWVRESLSELPSLMRASNRLAGGIGSAALDRVEAALLRDRVGEVFPAVVVEVRGERARVQLAEPAVTAQCPADGLEAGTRVEVRVIAADVPSGSIELAALATAREAKASA